MDSRMMEDVVGLVLVLGRRKGDQRVAVAWAG